MFLALIHIQHLLSILDHCLNICSMHLISFSFILQPAWFICSFFDLPSHFLSFSSLSASFFLSPSFIVSSLSSFCLSPYSPKFPFPISLLLSCHHLFSITLLFCWLMLEIFQEFLIHSAMRTVIFAFSLVKVLSHGEDDDGASLGQERLQMDSSLSPLCLRSGTLQCGMCERKLGPWGVCGLGAGNVY